MSSSNQDLANWLADIMDDSKPLPVQLTEEPALEQQAPVAADSEQSPVDEFLSEYLGETVGEVTQLCENVQAGPVHGGFVRPARPAPQVLAEAFAAGQTAAAMGADNLTVGEIIHNDLVRGLAEGVQQAAEEAGMESVEVTATPVKGFADAAADITPITFPKFVLADLAAEVDLRNFATLVTLNTSRWHAKVKDRVASRSASLAAGASNDAFETRKNLLVGADAQLKAVHKAIDEARASHYLLTVPFSTTSIDDTGRRMGGRLLPNTLFDEYIRTMAKHKAAMNAALTAFIPVYPSLILEAQTKLGDRFMPNEYPPASNIRQRFALDFEFNPIPMGDDFKGLAAQQLQSLARKLNESLQLQVENAMQDLWMRMHEVVSRMVERLGSPDKTFHGTLVQNARDIAHLAAHLNVTGDAKVEHIRKLIEVHLCQHDAKDLREKPVLRQETAAWAQEILHQMST